MAIIRDLFGHLGALVNNADAALDRQVTALARRAVVQAIFEANVFGLACLPDHGVPRIPA